MTSADGGGEARAAVLALLAARAPGATVCPSEVARTLAADWREAMPMVHAAVDALVAEGTVRLSWKRVGLPKRDGPYRIGSVAGQAGPIRSQRLPYRSRNTATRP